MLTTKQKITQRGTLEFQNTPRPGGTDTFERQPYLQFSFKLLNLLASFYPMIRVLLKIV